MSEPSYEISRASHLNAVGAKLFAENEFEPARLHFLAALSLEPNHPEALQNLGATLRNLQHYAAAEVVSHRSVIASGGNVFCRSNLGVSKLSMKKYSESFDILRQVAVDLPDSGMSQHNFGLILYLLGRYKEALSYFDKARALTPNNPQIESDRALTLLSLGNIAEGLAAYEIRWELLAKSKIFTMPIAEWQGEPLKDARILLHHEQGFGDSIMLSRFIPSVQALGAHITLAVPDSLIKLFSQSFNFIKVVSLDDENLLSSGVYDYHSPLLSTMRHLEIKAHEINPEPYLKAKGTFRLKLPQGFKIGICWASGNHGKAFIERRRVVPLTAFLPLIQNPGIALISLQMGKDVNDIVKNGLEGLVFDISPCVENFADTAAVISQLDVVITVDSAVAHLAGALGKPTIMLSPFSRCWRWWGKTEGWPWYSLMKILYQSEDGTWTAAMGKAIGMARKYAKVAS
jgi:tetratricopeptide (TPR) repeat protein